MVGLICNYLGSVFSFFFFGIVGIYFKSSRTRLLLLLLLLWWWWWWWWRRRRGGGSISSDVIGCCYKTFQSSFALNKFIIGHFRSRMRAPHPSRGSPTGDV
jgi:hypothetical protein